MFGSGDYAMRVWLDPNKIAARNLTASDVVSAIEGSDVFGHSDGVTDSMGNPVVQTTSSKFFNMNRRMIDGSR